MIKRKSFIDIHTVIETIKAIKVAVVKKQTKQTKQKPLLPCLAIIFMAGFLVFGAVGKAEGIAGSEPLLLLAKSNYFYVSPTITLEVKYKPIIPVDSTDKKGKPASADNTVSSDDVDNEELNEELNEGQMTEDMLDMAVSSDDQQKGQKEQKDQQADGEAVPHHNALIISRLTADHALHTEIEVDNITSQDAIFIDIFSGDVVQSGDTVADSVFISFENEEGTIETVRIGLELDGEEGRQGGGIDKITVLDGISEAGTVGSNPAPQDSNYSHHLDDSSFGLEQIQSPVIVIMPDTDERIYFIDGKKLKEQVFSKDYGIKEIRAVRDEVEIRLVEK